MKLFWPKSLASPVRVVLFLALPLVTTTVTTGCGSSAGSSSGGSSSASEPEPSGNTPVTAILSSTANDQLSQFSLVFQKITLTRQSGQEVTLLSAPQAGEFIRVNGGAVPLVTMTIPQDVYTAATVTLGSAEFSCVTLTPTGGLDEQTFAYGQTPTVNVTTTVPTPITVTGSGMGLLFNLNVSESATYSACDGANSYSITPKFTVTPVTVATQPTNPENGKVAGLQGKITAISATDTSFSLATAAADLTCPCPQGTPVLPVVTGSNTVYQGVNNFAALAVGTFVNMDGALETDGSLRATRIEVDYSAAVDMLSGPVILTLPDQPALAEPALLVFSQQQLGADESPFVGFYNLQSAAFQISGQLNNLQTLPFVPRFDVSNVVAGQNVSVASPTSDDSRRGVYTTVNTVTLLPQTIDATIVGASTSGHFSIYTVSLANYDLFPALALQPGQPTRLANSSQVEIYVDGNTELLNTEALAAGSTLRFYGLVFNDNGTLRMDCAQVDDGVALASPVNSDSRSETGASRVVRRPATGGVLETITTVNPRPQN